MNYNELDLVPVQRDEYQRLLHLETLLEEYYRAQARLIQALESQESSDE